MLCKGSKVGSQEHQSSMLSKLYKLCSERTQESEARNITLLTLLLYTIVLDIRDAALKMKMDKSSQNVSQVDLTG